MIFRKQKDSKKRAKDDISPEGMPPRTHSLPSSSSNYELTIGFIQ
jgi:hypothetical protein